MIINNDDDGNRKYNHFKIIIFLLTMSYDPSTELLSLF